MLDGSEQRRRAGSAWRAQASGLPYRGMCPTHRVLNAYPQRAMTSNFQLCLLGFQMFYH